jgi:von Willebrand factor type A domain
MLLLAFVTCSPALAQGEKKAYCVLIDNTGSLRSQFPQVLAISKGIVRYTQQRGLTSVFNFRPGPNNKGKPSAVIAPGIEWSQDRNALDNYVDSLAVQPGQTTLFDAIYSIAEKLNAKADVGLNALEGKVLILITDGDDRSSQVKEKQLIQTLKGSGITVYAVGLTQALDEIERFTEKKNLRKRAETFLTKIAKETGGHAIFPASREIDVDNCLRELFAGHSPAPTQSDNGMHPTANQRLSYR